MMDYRCYHLNPVGRFIAVEVYQCCTDAEACDRAHDMVADQQWGAFELWQLDRKVACPVSMRSDAPSSGAIRSAVFFEKRQPLSLQRIEAMRPPETGPRKANRTRPA
jgi:hypothetical protein